VGTLHCHQVARGRVFDLARRPHDCVVQERSRSGPRRFRSNSRQGPARLVPGRLSHAGRQSKALVFFTAILPQFINPGAAIGVQLTILGVSSIVIELVVLSIYVAACHRTRGFAQHARFATPLERVGGALLIAAGVRLAVTHRG
jgi:threonine/homoserine/homoserine lactone efflux protein